MQQVAWFLFQNKNDQIKVHLNSLSSGALPNLQPQGRRSSSTEKHDQSLVLITSTATVLFSRRTTKCEFPTRVVQHNTQLTLQDHLLIVAIVLWIVVLSERLSCTPLSYNQLQSHSSTEPCTKSQYPSTQSPPETRRPTS